MAADDREQLFEKALARQLRRSARLGEFGSAPLDSACADAETLAAYHGRQLPLAELHRWKQHFVACERCRDILAQLELTDEVPIAPLPDPTADSAQALVSVHAEARHPAAASFGMASASGDATPLAAPVSSAASSKTAVMLSRRRYWHWIAPAGAVAAGLLIWIAWHENRPLHLTVTPANSPHQELAAGPQSGETSLPVPSLTPQPNAASQRDRNSANFIPPSAPPAAVSDEKKALGLRESEIAKAKPDAAESNANSDYTLRKGAGQRSSVAQSLSNGAFEQLSANALQQNAPRPDELTSSAGAISGGPSTAPPNDSISAAKRAPPPAPAPPAKLAASQPAPADSVVAQQAAGRKNAGGLARTRSGIAAESTQPFAAMDYTSATVAPSGTQLIPAPGQKIVWKIDQNGEVTRSADFGKTWQPQDTGSAARLRAGSAPSGLICWLAGDSGTVVLTTDGGAHWTAVTPPANSTISEIVATDARVAIVTLQGSKIRFITSDGGQTWRTVER